MTVYWRVHCHDSYVELRSLIVLQKYGRRECSIMQRIVRGIELQYGEVSHWKLFCGHGNFIIIKWDWLFVNSIEWDCL